ncbi:hypothetical protein [Amphritea sp. HPY]|uniref:hypothetical protein n=1 Tax=Amphritea sp. HPY TaxID=3421652 RepID=UPI003D7CA889
MMNQSFFSLFVLSCGVITALPALAERKEDLVNPITYVVTEPGGYIDSPVNPNTVYDNKQRGFVDSEPMLEIKPHLIPERQLPPPTVIPHSGLEPVERIISAQQKKIVLRGEDKVFQQIADDDLKIRCLMDDALDQCEGVEIEIPEPKPRSRRVIDRQIQAQPASPNQVLDLNRVVE